MHFLADDEIETPKAHDDQGLEVSQLKFVVSNQPMRHRSGNIHSLGSLA